MGFAIRLRNYSNSIKRNSEDRCTTRHFPDSPGLDLIFFLSGQVNVLHLHHFQVQKGSVNNSLINNDQPSHKINAWPNIVLK